MKKLLIMAAAGLVLVGCRKEKEGLVQPDKDYTSSTDQAIANALWQDIYKQTDEAAQNEGAGIRSCASVTLNPIGSYPTTLTIDFGNGCLGNNGRYRVGIVEAVITAPLRDSGSVATITPINYSVNNYGVTGTKTRTNIGRILGHINYNVQVTNGEITHPDGTSFNWNSDITYKFIEGESTTFLTNGLNGILDDVYLIEGSYNGVNRQGLPFTASTTTDIRKELSCKWPVSGGLTLTPQGKATRTIDYGNGACDNDATVSVNGLTFNVQMQ